MSGVDEGTGVDDGGSFYSSSSTSIIPFIDLFLRQKIEKIYSIFLT